MLKIKKIICICICLFASLLMISCGDSNYDEDSIYNKTFNVKFVNWDASLLYETQTKYGEDAIYRGPTPTKEGTEKESYEFLYFTDSTYITKDTICVAVYKTVLNLNSEYYTNVRCQYERYGNGYKITKYYGTIYGDDPNLDVKKIVLPTMYEGLPVIAIGDQAFYEKLGNYRAIEFPKYLEEIGERAFYGASFSKIVTPSTLKSIGYKAFSGIYELTSITLNEGLESIGAYAFSGMQYGNKNFTTSITIPLSVKYMGEDVFSTGNEGTAFNIYCKASSKPSGWHDEWHLNNGLGGKWDSEYHNVYWGA